MALCYIDLHAMRPLPENTRPIDEALSRIGAKLETWQVSALFLGARASTNIRLGPHDLLESICGPEPRLGNDLEDVNANLDSLMVLWNRIVEEHRAGRVQLSILTLRQLPTMSEL